MSLDARLEALRNDRVCGAQSLALEALAIADDWAHEGRDWDELTDALGRMHPAIAMIGNTAERLAAGGPKEVAKSRESIEAGPERIAEKVAAELPAGPTVVTLSDSATVLACLGRLRPTQVRVLESLPGGEGRRFAERLGSAEVFADADLYRAVRGADFALVGADGFDDSGRLVHKVGTLPLALMCRHLRVAFYAAGHSLKRIPGEAPEEPPDPWFDSTPGSLITALFTEEGSERFMM